MSKQGSGLAVVEKERPPMDIFRASMIADGADGYEPESEEEYVEAWQLLIDTGVAWQLQGRIGRTAMDLIQNGVCTPPVR